jgi:hypothetical protein
VRVSEAIGGVLVDGGVEAFFGLAGSGNFAVLNALHEAGAISTLPGMRPARL